MKRTSIALIVGWAIASWILCGLGAFTEWGESFTESQIGFVCVSLIFSAWVVMAVCFWIERRDS